jgi:TonB family protein
MRAKVQGIVEMSAVVLPDGTVTDVQITRSLDQSFGLDEEAKRTARLWRFRPGTLKGEPVPVRYPPRAHLQSARYMVSHAIDDAAAWHAAAVVLSS